MQIETDVEWRVRSCQNRKRFSFQLERLQKNPEVRNRSAVNNLSSQLLSAEQRDAFPVQGS